jgi:hypothetical protein
LHFRKAGQLNAKTPQKSSAAFLGSRPPKKTPVCIKFSAPNVMYCLESCQLIIEIMAFVFSFALGTGIAYSLAVIFEYGTP